MSICPNMDIHSLYLDNELPTSYLAQYEEHIASCPKCKAELKKLRGLSSLFAEDNSQILMTNKDMDKSFERLQARLSYKKVAHKPIVLNGAVRSVIKDMCIGAAAAAVIAVVLPLRTNNAVYVQESFTPIARQVSFELPKSSSDADGVVTPVALSTFLGEEDTNGKEKDLSGASLQAQSSAVAAVLPFGSSAFISSNEAENINTLSLTSYDVFNPLEEVEVKQKEPDSEQKGFKFPFISFGSDSDK